MQFYRHDFHAMGSPCSLQFYAIKSQQAQAVIQRITADVSRLEKKYSRYLADSFLSQINRYAGNKNGIQVDNETAALLDYAQSCYQQSDGLFDITAGILGQVWTFKQPILPTEARIQALLPLVGWDKVDWQKPRLILPLTGMALDFGGIVKEYAVDTAASLCLKLGIKHGLIELGGDIRAIGAHPDGKPWQVGIRHPRHAEQLLTTIALKTGAIASSGDYERYIKVNGQRYCHILNPKTGWPIHDGLKAVSVIAEHCVVAGSVASIAMLKQQDGAAWLKQTGLDYVCM